MLFLVIFIKQFLNRTSSSLISTDSFILLLFTIVYYFLLKSLKEENFRKSLLYAVLSGIFIGAIQLTWVSSEFMFSIMAIFILVTMFIDIFKKNHSIKTPLKFSVILGTGFIVSLPYDILRNTVFNFPLYVFIVSLIVLFVYLIIKKVNFPRNFFGKLPIRYKRS